MSSPLNRPLRIELTVSASNPRLLTGLDSWLRLGLLTDAQVKQLCKTYLSSRWLPPPVAPTPLPPEVQLEVQPTIEQPRAASLLSEIQPEVQPTIEQPQAANLLPEVQPRRDVQTPVVAPTPSLSSRMWQSFQDELSVRWLMFLGVFLVVVSSGVLAATQWQNFPPVGQYGVLWGYTVIFWGIGIWASGQPNLRLTAQTLQLVSLLLVPVNFWAMDGFGLWHHPWEWIVVGVAAFTLTIIIILNQTIRADSSYLTSRASLILWLSYLHWGWQWSGFALIAVYLGVVGTAIFLPKRRRLQPNTSPPADESLTALARNIFPNAPTGSSVVIYALIVLLVRGIFVVGLPIEELGLAIAICGWLLARLGKPPETPPESASSFGSQLWDGIGAGLLFIGWLVAVGEPFPWQAVAVSGLAISFFAQRLSYSGRRWDLAAIFVIGLQTLFLLWRLVPSEVQQTAIALLTQLLGSPPEALLSLALFPYVIVWFFITDWLDRQPLETFHATSLQSSDTASLRLARFGEWLTLGLGVLLTLIGTLNPTVRSLNLLLSTLTLAIVTHRRLPVRIPLVYLTHIIGLLTIASAVNLWFPTLNQQAWAAILLALMVGEWSLSTLQSESLAARNSTTHNEQSPFLIWYQSCWHIGFVLAGLSYTLLWNNNLPFVLGKTSTLEQWQLLWLLTPLTLTGVATSTAPPRRIHASWWSVAALAMAQLLTLSSPGLRFISLGLATGLMIINTRYLRQGALVYLTNITGLLTVVSAVHWWFPTLNAPAWATVLLALMVGEWSLSTLQSESLVSGNPTTHNEQSLFPIWYQSCWHIGFVLAGLNYALLWNNNLPFILGETSTLEQWQLLWLLTPLTLTGVATRTAPPRRIHASWWSIAALAMAQFLTLPLPGVRLVCLGFATGLMLLNTRYLRQEAAAAITIGFALSFIAATLWEGIPGLSPLSVGDWFLAGAIAIFGLWLLRSLLSQRPGTLAALYAQAADDWAVGLCGIELLLLTLQCLGSYQGLIIVGWQYLIASILIGLAILYRSWQRLSNSRVYAIAWAIELSIAEGILLANGSPLTLATANIILALLTLVLTDWWLTRHSSHSPNPSVTSVTKSAATLSRISSSLEVLPLLYALLGIGLRWNYFTSYTGLLTLGAALTGIGIGRRRLEWKGISYLSIAGISIAWYELVIYQMLQAPAGNPADGFTIWAGVATAIAILYRSLAWFWQKRSTTLLNFSITEIEITAHIHWAIGSALMVLVAGMSLGTTPLLRPVGLVIGSVLAGYALLQGRFERLGSGGAGERRSWGAGELGRQGSNFSSPSSSSSPFSSPSLLPSDFWVYAGLTEVAATGVYARLTWTQLSIFDPWRVIITCAIAFFLYQFPWRRWGWNSTPFQHYALVSPLLTVWLNLQIISSISLLAVAGFYGWVAKRRSNLRWTYVSLAFIDWAIARWLENHYLTEPLWYATLIGLSLLYIAQVDPDLKMPHSRQARHYLRLLGSGIICLTAFWFHQDTGLIPGIISIITIFAGLGLRVRAFLFVGTGTFLLTVFYQLVVLSFRYPFSKWVIGLIVGILFISIAANFERRRDQIISMLQNWIAQLQEWA